MPNSTGAILALDVGDRRVGVAVSDLSQRTSRPLAALKRASGEAERGILELIEQLSPVCIVVGVPLNQKGDPTSQSEKTLRFCRRLEKRVSVPIVQVDEYLSSDEAKQRLKIEGVRVDELRKTGVIDSYAASIILERYLDSIHADESEAD